MTGCEDGGDDEAATDCEEGEENACAASVAATGCPGPMTKPDAATNTPPSVTVTVTASASSNAARRPGDGLTC